MQHFHTSVVIY